MEKNEVNIEVRFSEIDSMMIAHNSQYYVWFEIARFHFSKEILGFDIKTLNTDILLPVTKSNCKYIHHIRFADSLTIKTYMYVGISAKIYFYYEIWNHNNQLCALGSTEHVLLSSLGKMLHKIPSEIEEKFTLAKNNYSMCFYTKDQKMDCDQRINR